MNKKRIYLLGFILFLFAIPFLGRADVFLSEPGPFDEVVEITDYNDSIPLFVSDSLFVVDDDTLTLEPLRVAIVLSDIYGNKDMEFSRGFVLGLSQDSLPEASIALKIMNGNIPADSLRYEIYDFIPDVLISTFEKESPYFLTEFSNDNPAVLINVFDARNEDYKTLQRKFQILSPTQELSKGVSSYLMENYGDHVLFIVGEPDMSDAVLKELILDWPEEQMLLLTADNYQKFNFEEGVNYLVYPIVSGDKEIADFNARTLKMSQSAPLSGVRIIGRPNWITFNGLKKIFENLEVFIPAKCYFEPTTAEGKRFISLYNSHFKHAPVRSYPVYAAMGYDVAAYMVPELWEFKNGIRTEWTPQNMLQTNFNLKQEGDAGYYNAGNIMVHLLPGGTIEKELLNAD